MITTGIFKANDIRGVTEGTSPEWDSEGAYAIGAALVDTLDLNAGEGALVVGRDMRLSSPSMSAAFVDGVLSRGADVVDIGLASTDQLWFASGRLGLPGAMFTASHNPADYNGIKFCLAGARPIAPAQLREIADRATGSLPVPGPARGERSETDLLPAYADHLHSLVDLSGIRRLKVVADAGNGMAGHTLPAVLGSADLELIGLYTDPDGTFPNHPPNPLEPENLLDAHESGSRAWRRSGPGLRRRRRPVLHHRRAGRGGHSLGGHRDDREPGAAPRAGRRRSCATRSPRGRCRRWWPRPAARS